MDDLILLDSISQSECATILSRIHQGETAVVRERLFRKKYGEDRIQGRLDPTDTFAFFDHQVFVSRDFAKVDLGQWRS